jgi:uncharacterized protein YoxC
MTTDVTRGEFDHLKERVDVIEREVDGEKLVTRHILEQTRRNSDDLAAIKTRLDRVEQKVDGLGREVAGLGLQVGGLSRNLPTVVADVMREVLRERDAER